MDSSSGPNEENPNSDLLKAIDDISWIYQSQIIDPYNRQHKFWGTQPVSQFKDIRSSSLEEGPIEQPTPLSEIRQEPYKLPDLYEWTVCDMGSDEVCDEVYLLLMDNYVKDEDKSFRFSYSKEFLRWGLRPPGFFPSWHIGVRLNASKELVAFVSGIPVNMRVRDEVVKMAVVNFLCVDKNLRSKGLAPVMIKEISRRIHLENVWQAAYTADVLLPTPVSISKYWYRALNPKKLIDMNMTTIGRRKMKLDELPSSTPTPGLREMQLRDVPSVSMLLRNYLSKFAVAPIFDDEEVGHWLLPRENVVESYVVEGSGSGEITDFFSFYALPSSIVKCSTLKAAYSFYTVSTTTPLVKLMQDGLSIAKEKGFDVFNALDVMENKEYLMDLKFGRGVGRLYYYLYNYRLRDVIPSQLGLLLL